MNTSFKQLRSVAAKKKDDAIRLAKTEYHETIQKIAELEARLIGPRKPRPGARAGKPKIADKVWDILPRDKPFTLTDIMGILDAEHPERTWKRPSVYVVLNRFLNKGGIKRIAYAGHKQAAVFAMPDVELPVAKTMLDWAREIDDWESLPPVELMVKMTEAGYELEVPPNEAVRSLERELAKHT